MDNLIELLGNFDPIKELDLETKMIFFKKVINSCKNDEQLYQTTMWFRDVLRKSELPSSVYILLKQEIDRDVEAKRSSWSLR